MTDAILLYWDYVAVVVLAAFALTSIAVAYWLGQKDGYLSGYADGWEDRGKGPGGGHVDIPDHVPPDWGEGIVPNDAGPWPEDWLSYP